MYQASRDGFAVGTAVSDDPVPAPTNWRRLSIVAPRGDNDRSARVERARHYVEGVPEMPFHNRPTLGQPSRRAVFPLLAAVFLSLSPLKTARAEDALWQIYRREDIGFEVEMPGTPQIDMRKNGDRIETVDAQIDFENMLFGANYQEFRRAPSVEEEIAAQREGARHLNVEIVRENAVTMDGFMGRELALESNKVNSILRIFCITGGS
jgi:hypothetical protein